MEKGSRKRVAEEQLRDDDSKKARFFQANEMTMIMISQLPTHWPEFLFVNKIFRECVLYIVEKLDFKKTLIPIDEIIHIMAKSRTLCAQLYDKFIKHLRKRNDMKPIHTAKSRYLNQACNSTNKKREFQ